ncbi:hypothetical protein ABW20_dc0106058 [Dactylellina cionopaga]|nr:hypothetical protein ABW20_dc0106058 [Dactylellina cionopaga]
MGWFSKKEKVAPANPYAAAEAAPPPAYSAGDNTSAYTDAKSNVSGGYDSGAAHAKPNPYGNPTSTTTTANPYDQANPIAEPTGYGGGGGYTASSGYDPKDPYSTGGQKQMTAEEEEEADADALKGQLRFTKQESVNSTRRALQAANRAEELGRNTLTRLGEQGEKLHQTEMNIERASHHTKVAEDQTAHLQRLNRSMFVPAAGSPFGRAKKAQKEEDKLMERHRTEKEERDRLMNERLAGQQAVAGGLRPMGGLGGGMPKRSLAERAKFQFEADEEDDQMEDEIDDNLDQLGSAAGRLAALAKATGQVVDDQNKTIERLTKKGDKLDDKIHQNTYKLDQIK